MVPLLEKNVQLLNMQEAARNEALAKESEDEGEKSDTTTDLDILHLELVDSDTNALFGSVGRESIVVYFRIIAKRRAPRGERRRGLG